MYDPSDNVLSPTEVVSISVFSSCGSRGSVLVLELASVSSDTPAVDTDCTEPDLQTDGSLCVTNPLHFKLDWAKKRPLSPEAA